MSSDKQTLGDDVYVVVVLVVFDLVPLAMDHRTQLKLEQLGYNAQVGCKTDVTYGQSVYGTRRR